MLGLLTLCSQGDLRGGSMRSAVLCLALFLGLEFFPQQFLLQVLPGLLAGPMLRSSATACRRAGEGLLTLIPLFSKAGCIVLPCQPAPSAGPPECEHAASFDPTAANWVCYWCQDAAPSSLLLGPPARNTHCYSPPAGARR